MTGPDPRSRLAPSLPRGPRRIVCLTEEPTEILYALGEQERVVGISAYTVRPEAAKRDKPVVSAFIDGSVRKIKALEPDLVIGFSDIQAKLAKDLIAEHLQVLIFNQRSVQEIFNVIDCISGIVHARDRGTQLLEGYRAGMDRVAQRAARLTRRPRVYFEEWDEPMISGIRWVSELIEIAGGVDVFSDRARTGAGAKERIVSASEVIDSQPDLFLASWCGKAFDESAVRARPGFSELPALQRGRVHDIDPSIILQPGPAALTEGLDALAGYILDDSTPSSPEGKH